MEPFNNSPEKKKRTDANERARVREFICIVKFLKLKQKYLKSRDKIVVSHSETKSQEKLF